MGNYKDVEAKCPFFIRSDNNRICCEGVDKTNTTNLVFESTPNLIAYEESFCHGITSCRRCKLHQMLMRKYE